MTESVMSIDPEELDSRISAYETKWVDFDETFQTPTCCPGHMVPYDLWSWEQISDWDDYTGLRWLRGDSITWEERDD